MEMDIEAREAVDGLGEQGEPRSSVTEENVNATEVRALSQRPVPLVAHENLEGGRRIGIIGIDHQAARQDMSRRSAYDPEAKHAQHNGGEITQPTVNRDSCAPLSHQSFTTCRVHSIPDPIVEATP